MQVVEVASRIVGAFAAVSSALIVTSRAFTRIGEELSEYSIPRRVAPILRRALSAMSFVLTGVASAVATFTVLHAAK